MWKKLGYNTARMCSRVIYSLRYSAGENPKILLMEDHDKGETAEVYNTGEIRLYKRRWFLLLLFASYTANTSLHWSQFTSITNIVSRYYDVPPTLVEWTAVLMMAARAFLLFPALFLMERLETRNTLILATSLNLIGSCVKCFSVDPSKFYIAFTGQIFSALAITFTYSLVGRFSAAWFGSDEISRAGALCCAGDLLGAALSFLFPTLFVPDSTDKEEVARGLRFMHYSYTVSALITLTLIAFFFRSKPKLPPSAAQAHKRSQRTQRVCESLKKLFSNTNFLIFVSAQALLIGSGCNAVGTLLNEMIVSNFPGYGPHTGPIGCLNYICGIAGSVSMCYIQDKNRQFKLMAIILSAANCISLALFTLTLKLNHIFLVYLTYSMYGFFMNGYYGATIQMGIELSFPIAEGITTAAISVYIEVISMVATVIYGLAMKSYGDWKTNACATFLLFLSTMAICLVPPRFRREELERAAKSAEAKGLLYGSEARDGSQANQTSPDDYAYASG